MEICPYCASSYIYYSKKNGVYLCEDCDRSFDAPAFERGKRIFISYGHDKNQTLVSRIKDYLIRNGYDVWIDTSCIPKGYDWRERITDGLIASNGVIAFLSKHSVRQPGVCLDELKIAMSLKHAYVKSIMLENHEEVIPPYHLADRQWINMEDWTEIPPQDWDRYFNEKMGELTEALESKDALSYEEDIQTLRERLDVSETSAKEQKLLREAFVGRDWLTDRVQSWLDDGPGNRMMIFGVPGSGKSAFAANLSQYHPDVIASVFLEWDNPSSSNATKLICLLAYKLAGKLNDYRRMLIDLTGDTRTVKRNLKSMAPSELLYWLVVEPIHHCINGFRGRQLVIIDGMDETTEEIARLLYQKAALFPDWISFLFTSRHDETMRSEYASAVTIDLDGASKPNHQDIAQYAAHRLGMQPTDAVVETIAHNAEGSFMYAKTLCDAVVSGQIGPEDTSALPSGINDFYLDFMRRLFPSVKSVGEVRPLFGLLSIDEPVSDQVACLCLGIDKYQLWELRRKLRSLVVSEARQEGNARVRVLRFAHKSIKDWMADQELSGMYHVDPRNGYLLLTRTFDRMRGASAGGDGRPPAFATGQPSEETYPETYRLMERRYPYWLIRAGRYDDYKQLLIGSTNIEGFGVVFGEDESITFSRLCDLWKWVDQLPRGVDVSDLKVVLSKLVTRPASNVSTPYAHRGMQEALMLLKELMLTGRYQGAFYDFMGKMRYSVYFEYEASDLFDTRDGWDKYYMARDAAICLKRLDALRAVVPNAVRTEVERMKLTYSLYEGEPEGMFSHHRGQYEFGFGILCERELYKDVCTYNPGSGDGRLITEMKVDYNTTSLRYHLGHGEDVDERYVRQCVAHLADADAACSCAARDLDEVKRGDAAERAQYIERVRAQFSK